MTETKIVTIPHNGPIATRGGAMGPILTPHRVTLEEIGRLLAFNYPVIEHIDGKQVELKLSNLRSEEPAVAAKPAKEEAPNPKAEPAKEVKEVEEKKEEVKEEKPSTNKKHQGKNRGKNNNDRVEDNTESK